ncbi:MAG: adenosylcobinamide-GDP ribazoletransferase [Paracoccaceae bacterium]
MTGTAAKLCGEFRMGLMALTRIPVGGFVGEVPSVAASAWSWPLVGLVVGGAAALVYFLAGQLGLSPLLSAISALLVSVFLTGGLHEDGLADLADGFGGGADKDRILTIMRDSRIGSYGALAIGFSLILRGAALGSLAPGLAPLALVGLAAFSRALMPAALALMPPARTDGLGHAAGRVSMATTGLALILGLLALLPLGLGTALVVTAAACLAALATAWLAMRKIGGQTGDVCGAMQQIGEIAGWLAIAALAG